MNDEERAAVVDAVLAQLQAEASAVPEVIFETRADPDRPDVPRLLRFDDDGDRWALAVQTADLLSGQLCTHLDIYQVKIFTDWINGAGKRREEAYVVTSCGGSQYWKDAGGRLHQISSAGFCWDCHKGTDGYEQRGLVRHPVTPGEVDEGYGPYRCAVCGADMAEVGALHLAVPHVIIWGEEHHPRCHVCGKGYQTAEPDSVGYVDHDPGCVELHPELAAWGVLVNYSTSQVIRAATREEWQRTASRRTHRDGSPGSPLGEWFYEADRDDLQVYVSGGPEV
jgi:hypothetical protein